jgi:hypothetical protein
MVRGCSASNRVMVKAGSGPLTPVRLVATEGHTMARRQRSLVSGVVLIVEADEAYTAVIENVRTPG